MSPRLLTTATACLVEDPVTKRQNPRAYLQLLEERVATLETMLQETQAGVARDHYDLPTEEHPEPDMLMPVDISETAPPTTAFSEQSISREEDIERHVDRANDNGPLCSVVPTCLDAVSHGSRYLEASSGSAFSPVTASSLQRVQLQGPGMSMAGISDPLLMSPPPAVPCPLPCSGVGAILLQAYFDKVHPQYPFLHKDTILRWEKIVLRSVLSDDVASLDPVMMYFVNMVGLSMHLVQRYQL